MSAKVARYLILDPHGIIKTGRVRQKGDIIEALRDGVNIKRWLKTGRVKLLRERDGQKGGGNTRTT